MGSIKYCITGLNIDNFVQMLLKHNIYLRNTKRVQINKLLFEIDIVNKKKLKQILKKFKFKVKIIREKSLFQVFEMLIKRIGIIIGLIVSFSFTFYYFQNTRKIEIHCEDSTISPYVYSIVAENHMLSNVEIEHMVLKNIESVKIVNIYRKGIYIFADVFLKKDTHQKNYSPIVASNSGVVTKIVVGSGVAKVKVGDMVKKGDILIESKVDESGIKSEVIGEVEAKVFVTGKVVFNHFCYKQVKTGNKIALKHLEVFGKSFTIKEQVNTFNSFITQKSVNYVSKNAFFPFKIIETVVSETKIEKLQNEFNEDELKHDAYLKAKIQLDGENEETVSYSVQGFDDCYLICAYIETCKNICNIV